MDKPKKQSYLRRIIKAAVKKRQQLPDEKTGVVKKLNKGEMSEAEAQYKMKIINDKKSL